MGGDFTHPTRCWCILSDNAVLSFTGELESPMGIRINRYDLNGNDNYDLSTVIQMVSDYQIN